MHPCCEERRRPSCSERPYANVFGSETNFRSHQSEDGSVGGRDIGASDLYPLFLVAHSCERIHAGGAVVSKIYDAAKQCRHWKSLGVAHSAVANGMSLDIFFCVVKRRMRKSARDCVVRLEVFALKG